MKLRIFSTKSIVKWSWIIWGASTLFCIIFLVAMLFFMRGEELPFTKISGYLAFIWVGVFLIGCLAFAIASFLTLWADLPKNIFLKLILLPLAGAIFPIYLFFKLINLKKLLASIRQQGLKIFTPSKYKLLLAGEVLVVLLVILPFWLFAYAGTWYTGKQALGLVEEPLPIVGTGSMFPTWPKGTEGKSPKELSEEIVSSAGFLRYPNGLLVFGRNWFGHQLTRGDIVTFTNQKTLELGEKINGHAGGLLKRVVALPGDKIEIKNGLFFLNGQPQREPYIARARSTFGGEYLPDCKVVTIPDGMFFAMGDNRKGSGDSRHELGFVATSDIDRVIPFSFQRGKLDANWRNTENDLEDSAKIHINKERYLELLNEERKKVGSKPLRSHIKLEKSAELRGKVMLKYDDLSWEATRSGYPMTKALSDVKYSNITYGEIPSLGLYDAEELMENQLEFPETKKFLFDKNFQDIGISEVELEVNGCPKQITVAHFGGYIPPNYSSALIDSWRKPLENLRNIQSGWANLKAYSKFYADHRQEVDRINEIITLRINRTSIVVAKMESQKWLTNDENSWLEADSALSEEQNALASKLNSY